MVRSMDQSILSEIQLNSQFWIKHSYALSPLAIHRGIRFLTTCSKVFKSRYSKFHLTKILNAFCASEEKILSEDKESPKKRKVHIRILKINHSENSALGVAIVLKAHAETERLNLNQILRAISHLLPGVIAVPNISYSYRDEQNDLFFIYLEIEKKRGRGFSSLDLKYLKKSLADELIESVQSLSPSLFIIRNEEEIFRNIVQMSRELKTVHDIPQVTITFQEQTTRAFLRFSVVIVRLITKQSQMLSNLSTRLPKTLKFIPEMTSELGLVGKNHFKQANLVTFEVESSLFSRKNGSIDLREARAYVAKGIELMVGEYRDFNGGLLLKQNKQLKEIKDILEDSNKTLIESLFYSFTPSLFQTFILPEAGKACTSLVLEANAIPLSSERPYLLLQNRGENFSLIVIKTGEEQLKNRIQKEISNFSFPLHQFGYVVQCIESEYVLALIYQYPTDLFWFDSIKKLLQHAHHPQKQEKKFLKINFQDGDPLSLNPQLGLDLRCRSVQKALFEGLTRINPEGQAELAAADSMEISQSGLEYLFKLKPLQWSNGEELTAFQFEKTWKQAIKSPSCLRPDFFYVLANARKARFGKIGIEEIGVKALDKWRLKVTLEFPAPYFLHMLAHPLFFPLYEEHGEPFVFSGPFTLHSWKRDQSMVLIKNPYYWDFESVHLEGIEISILRDPYLAFEKYQKGEIDWIGGPFSLLPPSIVAQKQHELKRVDTLGLAWLYCNLGQPLLSSAKIRKALSLSLDRNKICQNTYLNPIPCQTHIPTDLSQLPKEVSKSDNDIHTLFEEGLEELKVCNFQNLNPLRLFHSHIPGQKELAIEVQKQWQQEFGIQIERIETTWNNFSRQLDNRLFHFGACYRHPFYPDPMYYFNIFYESTNIHNAFGWQSEKFNHFIDLGRKNPEDKSYLRKAEEELLEQMPVIPIHIVSYHYLSREDVNGIYFCHSGDVDFRWIKFEERLA